VVDRYVKFARDFIQRVGDGLAYPYLNQRFTSFSLRHQYFLDKKSTIHSVPIGVPALVTVMRASCCREWRWQAGDHRVAAAAMSSSDVVVVIMVVFFRAAHPLHIKDDSGTAKVTPIFKKSPFVTDRPRAM
jgi:hypothetical protein